MAPARRPLALVLFAVAYGTNVSTPLLLLYERELDLSRWTVTALFAVYPIGLAPALVYSGPTSDVIGRRPVLVPGVLLSGVASLVMLLGAHDLALLFVGRFLLGAVSGLAFVVASAWMQELSPGEPTQAAGATAFAMYGGFGLGPFVSGVLGEWGPWPLVLPYLVHVALVLVAMALISGIPETVVRVAGRAIRPNLGIPDEARTTFVRVVAPTALGVFGFPSLAFGLFPVLLRPAMESVAIFVTGLLGVIVMSAIIPSQLWVARVGPIRAAPFGLMLGTIGCGLGLVGFATDAWPLLFPAAVLMGAASGISMTSGLRLVDLLARPEDRGALTGAFYAVAYAAMTMPVIVATTARVTGFTPVLAVLTVIGAAISVMLVTTTRAAREVVVRAA